MRSQLFAVALALAPMASASPWADVLHGMDNMIVPRQNGNNNNNNNNNNDDNGAQQTPAPTQATTNKPTGTVTKGPITTDLNTGGNDATMGTVTGGGSFTKNSTTSTKTKIFNPQDPAGGAVMVTPAASLGMPLIMIEETKAATWVWNYTSVQGTPTAIDILIQCTDASQTITLTQNMTYKSPQTLTWDHAEYAATAVANQLRTDKYTLVVYDANSSPTDQASAGYLAPFNTFVFGLYNRKPYTDLADGWQCVTCSSAPGSLERTAIGFATSMSIVTILSFTWFVGGFGAML